MSNCERHTKTFILPALPNHTRMFSLATGYSRIIPPSQEEILSPSENLKFDLILVHKKYIVIPKLNMPRWIHFYINPYSNPPIGTDWIKLPPIRYGIHLDKLATIYAKIC